VIRIISACKYRDHTTNYFKELHILKFPDINFLQTALFMYTVDRKLLPSHLVKTFYQNNEIHLFHCYDADAKMILTARRLPTTELEGTTRASPYHVAEQ